MSHRHANIQALIKANNTTITSFAVDDFFTMDVLSKRLKKPLKQHADTLCSVYDLFHHRFHAECRYTEMSIHQEDKDILFTVFFDCGKHKFMLMFFSQFDTALTHQDKILHDLLADYDEIKESPLSLHDETLPANIHSLIHDLTLHEQKDKLKLKKIETLHNGQCIAFHQVSFPIDLESHRGISILAGFQY